MDALKKAEEEKKRAAKRLGEIDETVSVETASDPSGTEPENNEYETFEKKAEQSLSDSVELTLEPITDVEETKEDQDAVTDKKETTNANDTNAVSVHDEALLEATKTGFESEDITQENQTLSEQLDSTKEVPVDLNDTTIIENLSIEDASAPFDDTFHGVLLEEEQDTEIFEETLPGVPAQTLAKDLGVGEFQPTPVAAQTVFTAGKSNTKKSGAKTWTILGVLALLALVSFSVFYYFTITPVSRSLPSPLVARGIESLPAPAPVVTPVIESTETVSGTIIGEESKVEPPGIEAQGQAYDENIAKQIVTEFEESQQEIMENALIENKAQSVVESNETIPAEMLVGVQTGTETETEVTETEPEEISEISTQVSDVSINEEIPKNINEPEQTTIENEVVSVPVNNSIGRPVDTRAIAISKKQTAKQESVMVREAFNAFNNNQADVAKSLYEDVLKTDPDNRDAHLGLAAVAIIQEQRAQAYSHYVHLLKLDPADVLALNGLISLSNSPDPVADESTIKSLLLREGDNPHLYFSLGNLYAKQLRWPEAQQAFFDAYRLDVTNPDYAVNLAISLDRIGQIDAAVEYYETALNLSKTSPTRFDIRTVNNRLNSLSKQVN